MSESPESTPQWRSQQPPTPGPAQPQWGVAPPPSGVPPLGHRPEAPVGGSFVMSLIGAALGCGVALLFVTNGGGVLAALRGLPQDLSEVQGGMTGTAVALIVAGLILLAGSVTGIVTTVTKSRWISVAVVLLIIGLVAQFAAQVVTNMAIRDMVQTVDRLGGASWAVEAQSRQATGTLSVLGVFALLCAIPVFVYATKLQRYYRGQDEAVVEAAVDAAEPAA